MVDETRITDEKVESPALKATDLDITDYLVGSQDPIYVLSINDDGFQTKETQKTTSVGTTASDITGYLPRELPNTEAMGRAVVCGANLNGVDRFVDTIKYEKDAGVQVVDSTSVRGSPDGRSYSTSTKTIKLAMSANSYDVITTYEVFNL